jgi:hypothetical protein
MLRPGNSCPLPYSPRTPIILSELSCTNKLPTLTFMSQSPANPIASSSSSNFQLIINNALDKYKRLTKNDLLSHPLATQIQSCDSPTAILSVLHQQLQGQDQSRSSDERWSRWLDPTINVLYALSSTLAAGVSLVRLRISIFLRIANSYRSDRYFLQRM